MAKIKDHLILLIISLLYFTLTAKAEVNCECNGNGDCKLNTTSCQCKENFLGKNCEYLKCEENKCRNGGICVRHFKTREESCLCKAPFSGGLCELPVCLNYCYNNGRCFTNSTSEFELAGAMCKCVSDRFSGNRCQFDKCSNVVKDCPANCVVNSQCECLCEEKCDKTYCKGRGTCQQNNGELTCRCDLGYSGPTCLIDDCSGYCFNSGTCKKKENSIYCECPGGYDEKRCGNTFRRPNPTVPDEYKSRRAIIYGLTITLFICLISIGTYYAIQKGFLKNLMPTFLTPSNADVTPNSGSGRGILPFIRTNISFNKLEDEQSITQNEDIS